MEYFHPHINKHIMHIIYICLDTENLSHLGTYHGPILLK